MSVAGRESGRNAEDDPSTLVDHDQHRLERRIALVAALAIGLLLAPLSFLGDLRQQLPLYLVLATTATLLLYLLHYLLDRRGIELTARSILSIAIALRLLLLPMLPSLSDDVWRYLWDGRLLLHGFNPYHHIPSAPELARFDDELLRLQGFPDTPTIYPPGAQLLFATAVAFAEVTGGGHPAGFIFWKILLTTGEVAGIWLLLRLLDREGLSRRRAILYAWHPLALVELAGQGHTDGLWVLSLGLFLYMFSKRAPVGAAVGIGIGIVTRLFTVLLIPLWLKLSGKLERRAGSAALLVALLLMIPLLEPRAMESFLNVGVRFTNYYEFNGGFYRLVKWLLDELHLAPSNRIAGAIGSAVQVVLLMMIWIRGGRQSVGMIAGSLWIVTVQLLFGAKIHVWYVVAPLFLSVVNPRSPVANAWLWVALVGPFTYLYYAAVPHSERIDILIAEWGGFLLILIAGAIARCRA